MTKNLENSQIDNEFVKSIQQQMMAFAYNQLADKDQVPDVVQEALTAALTHQKNFKGQSMFKTWVFSILKNKIADSIRKNSRYIPLSQIQCTDESCNQSDEELLQSLFNRSGHWREDSRPQSFDNSWSDPTAKVHGESFWQVFELCLSVLPAEQSRVFLMREYIGLETKDICREAEISTDNFYVLMHRARLRLQKCLNSHWFGKQ